MFHATVMQNSTEPAALFWHSSHHCWHHAGTAIEIAGDSTQTVFEREVLPIMQQQEELWPAEVQTYDAFELHAGLVQSRAFHMLTENWITGFAQEGMLPDEG